MLDYIKLNEASDRYNRADLIILIKGVENKRKVDVEIPEKLGALKLYVPELFTLITNGILEFGVELNVWVLNEFNSAPVRFK